MNKKELVALGLTEEVADQIVVLHGKDIESHKAKLVTSQAEIDGLKGQLTEAGVTIESFKAMKPEELKAAADDYKTKYETAQVEAATALANVKYDYALKSSMTGAKVKYSNEVMARLKQDELKDKNGMFISERFNEQVAQIKTEDSSLFESDTQTPKIVIGGNNKSVMSDAVVDAARKAAGLPGA